MAILDNKIRKDYEHKKGIILSKTRIDSGKHIYRGPFFLGDNLPKENTLAVIKNVNSDKTNTVIWYKEYTANTKETIQDSYTGTTNSINCLTVDYDSSQVYSYNYCVYIDPQVLLSCLWSLRMTGNSFYCVQAYCNRSYSYSYTTYNFNTTNNCLIM